MFHVRRAVHIVCDILLAAFIIHSFDCIVRVIVCVCVRFRQQIPRKKSAGDWRFWLISLLLGWMWMAFDARPFRLLCIHLDEQRRSCRCCCSHFLGAVRGRPRTGVSKKKKLIVCTQDTRALARPEPSLDSRRQLGITAPRSAQRFSIAANR